MFLCWLSEMYINLLSYTNLAQWKILQLCHEIMDELCCLACSQYEILLF